MMQLNAKLSFFIVVSDYLLGSLTLWSNSWVGGAIYIIYLCAATLVRQLPDLPDRLLRPCNMYRAYILVTRLYVLISLAPIYSFYVNKLRLKQ